MIVFNKSGRVVGVVHGTEPKTHVHAPGEPWLMVTAPVIDVPVTWCECDPEVVEFMASCTDNGGGK